MIFYGTKAEKIEQFDIQNSKCQFCDSIDSHRISIFGKYAHIYWVPLFPIGRKIVAECNNCKKTINEEGFSEDLNKKLRRNGKKGKKPQIGIGLVQG